MAACREREEAVTGRAAQSETQAEEAGRRDAGLARPHFKGTVVMPKIPPTPQQSPVPRRARVSPNTSLPRAEEPEVGDPADYTVGYGRPPAHTQFKPGTSGNPKGRPPGARGIKTLVREMMTAKVSVRTATGVTQVTRIEALLHKILELASKGNLRAQVLLLNLYDASVPDAPPEDSGGGDATDDAVLMLQEMAYQFLASAPPKE